MALQVQKFLNFSGGKWAAFLSKIKADTGVEITTFTGEITHGSFVFAYTYDKNAEVLTVQCLKKPLFLPATTVINGLAEEIADLVPVQPAPVFEGDSAVPVEPVQQISAAAPETV